MLSGPFIHPFIHLFHKDLLCVSGSLRGPGDSGVNKNVKDSTVTEFTSQQERLKINKEMNVCVVYVYVHTHVHHLGMMCAMKKDKRPERKCCCYFIESGEK